MKNKEAGASQSFTVASQQADVEPQNAATHQEDKCSVVVAALGKRFFFFCFFN